jgi:hypothetical protein
VSPGMSDTAMVTIDQLRAQLPATVERRFVYDSARPLWVRVNLTGRGRNIDVTYDPASDLYDVAVHDLVPILQVEPDGPLAHTREFAGVFFDQLGELMATPREGADAPLFEPRGFEPEVRITDWEGNEL